jgi:hypothetical protein
MNKRTVIANLNKIANELDNSGMFKEATEITNVMKRIAQDYAGQESAFQMATPVNYSNPQLDAQIQANRANNIGDIANKMQAQNTMPAESPLYQQAINQIAGLLKTKNPMFRTQAQKIYEDTFVQLKDPKRKQAFANQFQRLVSQNFPAQSPKPGSY